MRKPKKEPVRFIGDGGDVEDRPPPPEVTEKDLLSIFRSLVLLRTFDERAVALQRQGRIGTYPMFWGEEATQAGPFHAAHENDWLFPSYRQSAVGILRGLPPETVLRYRRGYGGKLGFWNPRVYRVAPSTVSIATHLPHAVGLSWAAGVRGDPVCALVWFGDGATSEGDFHEAMNFSGVFKTPTIFFCTNNQWAISTPLHRQTAVAEIGRKAEAYGIPWTRVDGFDPVACHLAAGQAFERARSGGGPIFIEAVCYRLAPHGTADDPRLYRDEEETLHWRRLEPVGRMGDFLERLGVLDPDGRQAIMDEARETIGRAVEALEATPDPGPEIMFETLYASERPWTLEEGLSELRSLGKQ